MEHQKHPNSSNRQPPNPAPKPSGAVPPSGTPGKAPAPKQTGAVPPSGTPGKTPNPGQQPYRARRRADPAARAARRRRQRRARLVLAASVLAVVVLLVVIVLVACNRGPKAPAVIDPGTSAGAWAKNEAGYFFNDVGEPILAATKKGIDVSKYQGEVDWEKAQAAGVEFAMIRCGYGSEWNGTGDYAQDDEQWRRNADECTRLGIPFGTYLYSYATTEEQARSEAEHVARLLGLVAPPYEGLDDYTASPYQLSYPVYYDLEDKAITGLYPDEMAHLTEVFFDRLKELGYQGEEGIYASLNWTRGRLTDPAFDRWRDNLWIARFNSTLDYTGSYAIWQSTYTEPGAKYGVQSETVDVDFVMEELTVTGLAETPKEGAVNPTFTNDTYKNELWLPKAKTSATLTVDAPQATEEGQKIFWTSDNESVATVNRNGKVTARGDGQCTVTAALADGRQTASITVRVGGITVPVYVTGNLAGRVDNGESSLADLAALKASDPDAILVDAGGSLQGTARASLTGGMDMTSAFAAAGYDLQAFGASDLAYGSERLTENVVTASGPSLAANLLTEAGDPLLARTTCWSRNRISNGMNYIVQQAGKKIGFFALCITGSAVHADGLVAADLAMTASEQVAALQAEGADAIVCIAAPGTDVSGIRDSLAQLGVCAILDGSRTADAGSDNGSPVLVTAGAGWDGIGKVELHFDANGGVTASTDLITSEQLKSARGSYTDEQQAAYDSAFTGLQKLADGDEEVRAQKLFTFAENETASKTISFANYVASFYLALAEGDRANWPADATDLPVVALAGGVTELSYGDITRGALCDALPSSQQLLLVRTTSAAVADLIDSGNFVRPYEESLTAYEPTDGDVLLVTNSATLDVLTDDAQVLRDYGDVFWDVRMNINDLTNNFTVPFTLPEAPQRGAGRK
ncbi:MAG: GH25 family lysozyme [Gemmiger sp.]|uniref:GH25 family lysozyme n=1 Tax=Gemmiger sp. TaxID=2049027 RepID=UPI002E762B33|nr:GH25 family lysozyme [Gemmiger sp.]MEE0801080.1 GH25 family lysozyme [Gemmiger sp.]